MANAYEMMEAGKVTYRQLDYWTGIGILRLTERSRRGRTRNWPESELDVVRIVGYLVNLGIPPEVAGVAVRNEGYIGGGVRIVVDPGEVVVPWTQPHER